MAGILIRPSSRLALRTGCLGRISRRTLATSPITTSHGAVDLQAFRQDAFEPEKPFLFRGHTSGAGEKPPAATKWFEKNTSYAFSSYVKEFLEWPFPYELVLPSTESREAVAAFRNWLLDGSDMMDQILAGVIEPVIEETDPRTFYQLYAPLKLLAKALKFNESRKERDTPPLQLYIAQSLLSDLPRPLLEDLPTPEIVLHAGQGDVYSSSIWLGTEPTYTPLHRDPNPNLFCQLCSSKVLRLLPPTLGEQLFFQVQARIRQQANSRIRTVEMMEGKEREELHRAVWNPDEPIESLQEVQVHPGDSLFIPKGWWHSVKSIGSEGGLNGSVNWWFR